MRFGNFSSNCLGQYNYIFKLIYLGILKFLNEKQKRIGESWSRTHAVVLVLAMNHLFYIMILEQNTLQLYACTCMSDLHCVFLTLQNYQNQQWHSYDELGTLLVNPIVNMHVVFDVIHLNDGNGYNNVHGIFTAPIAGIYHFTMALTSRRLRVIMMKSNTPIAAQYLDDKTDRWLKQSATVIVHLVKGDDVWVKVTEASSGSNIYGCCYTSCFFLDF